MIRPRRDGDVPALVTLLAEQQPTSRYPLRWPLPFPVEEFLVRASEERAWVAELDGALAGHVAVTGPDDGVGEAFARLLPGRELASVSVLFTGLAARGSGLGGRLLDTAVDAIRASGRQPVLDVVHIHDTAVAVYRRRGWIEIGRLRPDWLPTGAPDVLLMTLPPEISA